MATLAFVGKTTISRRWRCRKVTAASVGRRPALGHTGPAVSVAQGRLSGEDATQLLREDLVGSVIEKPESCLANGGIDRQGRARGLEGDRCRPLERVAVDARGDRGECDPLAAVGGGQVDRSSIAGCEQRRF